MKGLRALSLLSIVPFMVSCSGPKYIGEYVFQMGKSKDTHIGVSLLLSDLAFSPEHPEKGNSFTLTADISNDGGQDEMFEILEEFNPLTGSYIVDEEATVYGATRLRLFISLLGEYEIPEDVTDKLFVANITPNIVNFYLPVSIRDLTLQLYWYGFDFDLAGILDGGEESSEERPEPEAHPVGTHPTKEDVEKINPSFKKYHGYDFRDYHVLQLGLTKK